MKKLIPLVALAAVAAGGAGFAGTRPATAAPYIPEGSDCRIQIDGNEWRLLNNCTTAFTIELPGGVEFNGQGRTITAVDPGFDTYYDESAGTASPPGGFEGAILGANGGSSVEIHSVTLTTALSGSYCDGYEEIEGQPAGIYASEDPVIGVGLIENDGYIHNVRVVFQTGLEDCRATTGILVSDSENAPPGVGPVGAQPAVHDGEHSALIFGNRIYNFNEDGIDVEGNSFARILGNIIFSVEDAYAVPPANNGVNGVVFGGTPRGQLAWNYITVPPSEVPIDGGSEVPDGSFGVLVIEGQETVIQANIITGPDIGVGLYALCFYGQNTFGNQVKSNLITGVQVGVALVADVFFGTPGEGCIEAEVYENDVVGNVMTGLFGYAGILVVSMNPDVCSANETACVVTAEPQAEYYDAVFDNLFFGNIANCFYHIVLDYGGPNTDQFNIGVECDVD
jgi:hypothetical protein